MIRVERLAGVYGEVWFDEEPPRDPGVDIVLYRQRRAPVAGARQTAFLSLVNELSVDEDAITGQFGKEARYKIRRAEKDGLFMELIPDPESRLDEFRAFYDAFARQKSLDAADHPWLLAACRARQLALTSASRDGEALVWHAYVVLGDAARLQYTGSCFRDRGGDYRALVGRANRWLHWRDMLQLRDMGLQRYDWGGLFADESTPERAGINEFKRGFGGRLEHTYDCTVPVTVRGRAYLALRDAWRHWKARRSRARTRGSRAVVARA